MNPLFVKQVIQNKHEVLICSYCSSSINEPHAQLGLITQYHTRAEATEAACSYKSCVQCRDGCGDLYCSMKCQEAHWNDVHWLTCVGAITEEESKEHPLLMAKKLLLRNGVVFDFVMEIVCRIVSFWTKSKDNVGKYGVFDTFFKKGKEEKLSDDIVKLFVNESSNTSDTMKLEQIFQFLDLYFRQRKELNGLNYDELLSIDTWYSFYIPRIRPTFVVMIQENVAKEITDFIYNTCYVTPSTTDMNKESEKVMFTHICAILQLPLTLSFDEVVPLLKAAVENDDDDCCGDEENDHGHDEHEHDEEGEEDTRTIQEKIMGYICESLPLIEVYGMYEFISFASISEEPTGNLYQESEFELKMGIQSLDDDYNGILSLHPDSILSDNNVDNADETKKNNNNEAWMNATEKDIINIDNCVTKEECKALISYLEANIHTDADSVDGLPDFQADFPRPAIQNLRKFIRDEAIQQMWDSLRTLPVGKDDARVAEGTQVDWETLDAGIFIRKYSPDTRKSLVFHEDVSSFTINIALNGDDEYEGGDLVAVLHGEKQAVKRACGTVTIFGPNVLHRVEKMIQGNRYSMILFLFNTKENEATAKY